MDHGNGNIAASGLFEILHCTISVMKLPTRGPSVSYVLTECQRCNTMMLRSRDPLSGAWHPLAKDGWPCACYRTFTVHSYPPFISPLAGYLWLTDDAEPVLQTGAHIELDRSGKVGIDFNKC